MNRELKARHWRFVSNVPLINGDWREEWKDLYDIGVIKEWSGMVVDHWGAQLIVGKLVMREPHTVDDVNLLLPDYWVMDNDCGRSGFTKDERKILQGPYHIVWEEGKEFFLEPI